MIAIDKNIPIGGIKRGRPRMYPFAEMEIGDSCLFEKFLDEPRKAVMRASATAGMWVKHNKSDRKFTCRTVENGIRIFRIK